MLSARLGVPHVELDSLHHVVRNSIWARADTIVWLDLSRAVVMGRVIRRSLARVLRSARALGGGWPRR